MENKLTQASYYADNVLRSTTGYEVGPISFNMDENLEVNIPNNDAPKKDVEEKEELQIEEKLTEVQAKAKKGWEDFFKKRKEAGVAVTDQQKKIALEAIKKGHSPEHEIRIAGGAGDDRFSNFDVEAFKDTQIEPLARELREAAERGEITQDFIDQLSQRARQGLMSEASEKASKEFIEKINRIIAQDTATAQNQDQQEAEANEQDAQDERVISEQVVAGANGQELSIDELLDQRVEKSLQKKEARSSNPRSIQEVALSIINDEGRDRWGPNGTFPLLEQAIDPATNEPLFKEKKYVNSDGVEIIDKIPLLKLKQENFIRWFRERMMYHHLNNSRDESLQLGNLVGVQSEFGSTISVFSMDKDRAQYFSDEISGLPLDTLANQMKMELWLFGNMRNHDLLYQNYMGSDSDLPKYLANLHNKEEITQPQSLETIMTLPKDYGVEGDTAVGDGIRKAYEVYFYASDWDGLKKVLGEDSPFFKKEGFINAFRLLEGLDGDAQFENLSPEAQKFINNIFSDQGGKPNKKKFLKEMNPFNEKNKPEFNKRIIREMVRQVIAKKYNLDDGLDAKDQNGNLDLKKRDLVRKELEYSEAFAWVLTRWTGAAARNDTSAIGFDAFTKTLKFRDYRKRQSNEGRAGQFGNEYDLPVFKGLTSDFFNGITVEKKVGEKINYTPFEIFRKIDDIEDRIIANASDERVKKGLAGLSSPADLDRELLGEINKRRKARGEDSLEKLLDVNGIKVDEGDTVLADLVETKKLLMENKEDWAKRLNFEQFIQRSYSADHINRGFEIFHSTLGAEELRLEEIVKWDPLRGIIFDRGKFEEQVKEKFIKPTRYAFSTYAQLDLGKTIRVQTGGFGSNDVPIYEDKTMAEAFFGPEVLRDLRPKAKKWFEGLKGKDRDDFFERMQQKDINFGSLSKAEKRQAIWQDYLSSDGRSQIWKRAVMARMAAHIKSHRQFGNNYTPFTAGMVETLYQALESIRSVEIEEDDDQTNIDFAKRFLDEDDIRWIRKMSGTTKGKLFINDFLIKGVGWGATKGAIEGLKDFVKDIFK